MLKTLTTYIVLQIFSSVTYAQEPCCWGLKYYLKDSSSSIVKKNQYVNNDYQIFISIGTIDLWHAPTIEFDTLTNTISSHLCYNKPVCIDPRVMFIHGNDTMTIEFETGNGLVLEGYEVKIDSLDFDFKFRKGCFYSCPKASWQTEQFLLEKRIVTREEYQELFSREGHWTQNDQWTSFLYNKQQQLYDTPKLNELKWTHIEIK